MARTALGTRVQQYKAQRKLQATARHSQGRDFIQNNKMATSDLIGYSAVPGQSLSTQASHKYTCLAPVVGPDLLSLCMCAFNVLPDAFCLPVPQRATLAGVLACLSGPTLNLPASPARIARKGQKQKSPAAQVSLSLEMQQALVAAYF